MHQLEHAFVNCYLLVEAGEVTIVDAAFPATWALLPAALEAVGRRPEDVRALVLTGHRDGSSQTCRSKLTAARVSLNA